MMRRQTKFLNTVTRKVPRPHLIGTFHENSHAIDDANRIAQDLFRLQFIWGTNDKWLAVIRGFWSICVVDAYHAQRFFQPRRHKGFRPALVELVEGLLARGLQTQHGGASQAVTVRTSPRTTDVAHPLGRTVVQVPTRGIRDDQRGYGPASSRKSKQEKCAMCKLYNTQHCCQTCTVERGGVTIAMPLCRPGSKHADDKFPRDCYQAHLCNKAPGHGCFVRGEWWEDYGKPAAKRARTSSSGGLGNV
jgi:hypothetical protein